jgi:hypothetical protein
MTLAAAATSLPSLWTGLLRRWAQQRSAHTVDPVVSMTRAEAIAHLKTLIHQYEQSQPSYADDLRSALAQLGAQGDAR